MPSINGLPYPALSDPNNPPADFLALATAIDGKLSAIDGSQITSGKIPAQRLQAGSVLQVKSTTKTNAASSSLTTWSNLMSVSITPLATSSKILIIYSVNASVSTANWGGFIRVTRGTTAIYIGDASGSRTRASSHVYPTSNAQVFPLSGNFLDSPNTTSAVTYSIEIAAQNSSNAISINRLGSDVDAASSPSLASTITVFEIAG